MSYTKGEAAVYLNRRLGERYSEAFREAANRKTVEGNKHSFLEHCPEPWETLSWIICGVTNHFSSQYRPQYNIHIVLWPIRTSKLLFMSVLICSQHRMDPCAPSGASMILITLMCFFDNGLSCIWIPCVFTYQNSWKVQLVDTQVL